jgi:histone-lysine N-methyltransferase SETMAR
MEWKHPTLPVKKKFKTQPLAGNVMLTFFGVTQGPILECYEKRATTVSSICYNEILQDRLKPDIRTKCRGVLLKGVTMLYYNACLYTAAHTVESLCHINFEVLKHPPYSPDLAPSDCHLFDPLKDISRGFHFTID